MKVLDLTINHTGLLLEPRYDAKKLEPLSAKSSDRPTWADDTRALVHVQMQQMRLAFEHSGALYARCYMCLAPGLISNMQVDHIVSWESIHKDLFADAANKAARAKYPGAGAGFFVEVKGGWAPTAFAGIYYSNNLNNLILIHGGGGTACNQSKSDDHPEAAVMRNVYSPYGNLVGFLNRCDYPKILKVSREHTAPVPTLIAQIRASNLLWHQLLLMNEEYIAFLDSQHRAESTAAAQLAAVTPLTNNPAWANTAKLPNRRPATDNQQAAMEAANRALSVEGRRRSFSDDTEFGSDGFYVSPRMQQKLSDASSRRQSSVGAFAVPAPKAPVTGKRERAASPPPEPHKAALTVTLAPPDAGVGQPPHFIPPPPGSPPLRRFGSDE